MAKKTRVPPPPRQVPFPQTRKARKEPRAPRTLNRRILLLLGAGGGVAVVAAVAAVVFLGSSSPSSAASVIREAGCRYTTYPGLEGKHVPPTAKVKYNSFPPTSGPMTEETVIWGTYREPVGRMQLLHNLEHSGVAIQYGPRVDEPTLARLEDFYEDDPNGLVVAPLPGLGDKIALAAWNVGPADGVKSAKPGATKGILAVCPGFDDAAFRAFLDAHRYKGPERPPREALEPGQGM